MPNYMKAQILQGKTTVGNMEKLESQISYYKNKRALAFKNRMNLYLSDTIHAEESYDSMMVFLENESSISAKYQLAALQLESGNIQQVNSTLTNIENQFNLNPAEEQKFTQMQSYFALLIELQQNGHNQDDLSEEQLVFIEDMELNGNGEAKSFARNIRRYLGVSDYEEPYVLPNSDKSTAAVQVEQEIFQSLEDLHYIRLAPNPAKNFTTVEYLLEEKVSNALLQITDLSGKVLSSQSIEQNQDQMMIDTRNFKAGNYLLSIFVDGNVLETVQLNVIK